jgi:hypothetical protein
MPHLHTSLFQTAALGAAQGYNFYLSNHESRGRVLGMDGWSYKWYDAGGADAGHNMGLVEQCYNKKGMKL